MTPKMYECGLLALSAWRASKSDNIDEILAIASVLRNRVIAYNKTYSQVCEAAIVNRSWPDIRHPALIHPASGILAAVDGIYDNSVPDYTSNHLHKNGALHFARVVEHQGTGDDFEERIIKQYEAHPLIGTFGTQQFFE
jgi:hypothetical protein